MTEKPDALSEFDKRNIKGTLPSRSGRQEYAMTLKAACQSEHATSSQESHYLFSLQIELEEIELEEKCK